MVTEVEKSKDPKSRMTVVWLSGKMVRQTIPPESSVYYNYVNDNYFPGSFIPRNITYLEQKKLVREAVVNEQVVWRNKFIDRTGSGHFTALLSPAANTYIDRFGPNVVTETNPTRRLNSYNIIQQQLDSIPKIDQFGKPTAGQPLSKTICLAKDSFNVDAQYVVVDGKQNLIQWVDGVSKNPSGPVISGTAATMSNPPAFAVIPAANGVLSGFKNFTKEYLTYQFLS